MKKLFSLILVVAMLLTSVAALAEVVDTSTLSGDEKAAALGIPAAVVLQDTDVLQGKRIGCSIVYKGDEWCAAVANALEALGAYYGAEIACEDGDLNDETQTKQIENMIANNVDIMMIDPATPDGCGEALNEAYEAGIPIIIYDGYWTEGEEKAITTVTWDQYQTGVITGEYFLNYLRDKGVTETTIVELTNAVSTHCQERFVGLHDTFDAAEDIKINVIDRYDSQGNRETAEKAISAVVQPYEYIISDVDNGAQGAVAALQQVGDTDVKVFSMGAYGAEPFGLLHDEDPNYTACLNVDAWVLAQFIFDGAIKYYAGEENDKLTNIALFMVDSSNVEDFWTFD
ncbi:MAG: sugar ABC transporter substrate-binding protein [Clostridia bacterium]|nr:sugar ABC transporter substrate-binding protein [Clostridia bacterium]